jgi:hypothetical protein
VRRRWPDRGATVLSGIADFFDLAITAAQR